MHEMELGTLVFEFMSSISDLPVERWYNKTISLSLSLKKQTFICQRAWKVDSEVTSVAL